MKKPRNSKPSVSEKQSPDTPLSGRSVWSGQLRLALVSIPVQLISAVKTGARLTFHQIDAKSRKRIRYEKVAPGLGPVDKKNIVKGFEMSSGQYVLVTDDDLETVKLEARRTIDLIQFVDQGEISPIYFEKPYYVIADGKLAEEAYSVLRDALRKSNKIGLGQFIMRGREYVAALKPCGRGLMLETLRFSDEVRKSAPFFADIDDEEPNEELLELAQDLIKRKAAKFDPSRFHDHYTEALRKLIEAKAKHLTSVDEKLEEESSAQGNVVDLVAALRKSVQQSQTAKQQPVVKQRTRAR